SMLGCVAPNDVSAKPTSIEDLIALTNALSRGRSGPLTLPCLLESLDRPLGFLAARSVLSLQPAAGARSPRMFLFAGALVLSVVPAGVGEELLEISLPVSETRSIKAEIHFPVAEPLALGQPFSHIRIDDGTSTTCSGCHGYEEPSSRIDVAQGFESDLLRPLASQEV